MAVGDQLLGQLAHQPERIAERLQIGDLAADVHVNAADHDAGQLAGLGIELARLAIRNAELVLRLAGGDLGVRLGVDVGIDTQRYVRVCPSPSATSLSARSSGSPSTLKPRMPCSSA